MQIFVINLDAKPKRWQRMTELLHGLPFKRIAAVDGKTIDGPEQNGRPCPEELSRYHRGCILSHRAAYQEFLAGPDRYCCVLEDDVFISPDFPKFIKDDSWIPAGCDLVKIETTRHPVWVMSQGVPCRDRQAARLLSIHLGTAGYIVSRRGAEVLLETTALPARAMDRIVYGRSGRKTLHPVYQLIPALCIQGSHRGDGVTFPEMESSIYRQAPPPPNLPPVPPPPKPLLAKIKRELMRPFNQFQVSKKFARRRKLGLRRKGVPFV
jgi:glycosyl transferase family 25